MAPLLGIFGGTFDPPHIGHLILAEEARAELGLEQLLWVLTPDPPHKQGQSIAPLEHRLAMVQLAIAGNPSFKLSNVEIDRPGPHYALDTVKLLSQQNPGYGMVYLMGGDSLADLPTWHRSGEFVAACQFLAVIRRPDNPIDLAGLEAKIPGLRSKVRFVNAPLLDIASHEIRRRIAQGRPFLYFLPPAVFGYIKEHHLYRQ